MKILKSALLFFMVLILALSFIGCKKDKGDSSGSSVPPASDSSDVQPPDEQGEKVTLLFEVDEGLGGYEFVAGCKKLDGSYDFGKMDIFLNNIYEGVKQFEGKYKVALHIYPEWYYKEGGWSSERTGGLQKWSDDFLYAMDFCEEKGIEVYLEILSSTIYVCQNGEEGSLPVVNINHGISDVKRDVWGCSCDFQSLRALKKEYPSTFAGLRFHELIGTENLATLNDPHACHIYEEDIYAIADEAKALGLKLMWSDQFWGHGFKMPSYAFWLDRVDNVKAKLGNDLVITLANNSDDVSAVVGFSVYDLLVERFSGATMGYSNQAWFLDSFILNDAKSESQAYIPVEIVAGFAQKAILRGAKVIQFEPFFHLFNYTRQSINGGKDYNRGGIAMNNVVPRYEEIQGDKLDYSPRSELYRLADYLNADEFVFANVEDFFDTLTSKIKTDSIIDPPKMYQQTTIFLSGKKNVFIDKYNNNPNIWLTQSENRFTDRVINSRIKDINRVSYTYGAFDDVINVIEKDGKNVGIMYNSISGKVLEDKNTFANNSDGEFIGFTTANLIKSSTYRGKDSDEIIVFRKKDNVINLCLYSANLNSDGYSELTGAAASVIEDYFGSRQLPSENFAGVYGVRNSKAIGKTTCLRNVDGLIAVYANGNKITVTGKRKITSPAINQTIMLDGGFLCATVGDVDLDINSADELIIAYENANGSEVVAFGFEKDRTLVLGEKITSIANDKISQVCTFGKFYYQNDSNL